MIYRIIGEADRLMWSEKDNEYIRIVGVLKGAMYAGFYGMDELPYPRHITNPRVRFWFTERGWSKYGRYVLSSARTSGRTYRLIRQKNPPRSSVVYRDEWQVALLPPRKKEK